MTETQIRERLSGLVDPLPIDLDGRLAAVRGAPPRHGPNRALVAVLALSLAAGATALAVWAFTRTAVVRPAVLLANGRIVFEANAPGYVPPTHSGFNSFPDTDLYSMNPDGSSVRQLTSGSELDRSPAWSPDGKSVAFVRSSNLFLMRSDGTGLRQLTFCRYSGCVGSPAWSPDGEWIGYLRGWDLYLVKPDGTANHLISHCGDCTYAGLGWSPDGSSIVLGTDGFPGQRFGGLVVLTLADPAAHGLRAVHPITFCEQRRALCHRSLIDSDPSWSPDGAWIVFAHARGISLVRPDGTDEHRLARCPEVLQQTVGTGLCSASHPVWAPDGTRIAFQGREGIYMMNADGTGATRIHKGGSLGSWQGVLSSSPQAVTGLRGASCSRESVPASDCAPTTVRHPPSSWRTPASWEHANFRTGADAVLRSLDRHDAVAARSDLDGRGAARTIAETADPLASVRHNGTNRPSLEGIADLEWTLGKCGGVGARTRNQERHRAGTCDDAQPLHF